jgi:hypothetical protein
LRPPRASAVALWSSIQCAALLSAATGVRLWPHHPDPPESLALPELVAAQMVGASLLFQLVVPDLPSLMVNLALSVPFLQLAGLLSDAPQDVVWAVTAFVGLWVGGLSGWSQLTRGEPKRAWLICLAGALTVGGVLVWYVRVEAVAQNGGPPPCLAAFGPLLVAVGLSTGAISISAALGWTLVATPLVTSLGTRAWAARRLHRLRPPLSPTDAKSDRNARS